VSTTSDPEVPMPAAVQVPAALAEYADRLVLSTGLHAEDALLIASGKHDPPAELQQLVRALRAGWDPGWTLDIPLPSTVIEEHDGARWYVVQPGDTLCGIAARLLGGEARYTELSS
jgi:nucleoid-associated protein YgaU